MIRTTTTKVDVDLTGVSAEFHVNAYDRPRMRGYDYLVDVEVATHVLGGRPDSPEIARPLKIHGSQVALRRLAEAIVAALDAADAHRVIDRVDGNA